ncbi:hypothetical protein L1049_011792 [Liquidambar formosana]|uniref:C2 domain-containing protein n=1 Tax=Liquidambar formosana TaxID=63359 RepID=A0AAP0RS44_LIQFO
MMAFGFSAEAMFPQHRAKLPGIAPRGSPADPTMEIRLLRKRPRQGGSPVWNEKFSFRVEYPGADDQYKLVLKIMDKDTFSSDDFLGQATIYLRDVLALGVENGSAELQPCKYSVVNADQSYCGEIEVGVTFTPKEETEEEEIGGWKESDY